jgi:hypothetical protein
MSSVLRAQFTSSHRTRYLGHCPVISPESSDPSITTFDTICCDQNGANCEEYWTLEGYDMSSIFKLWMEIPPTLGNNSYTSVTI